jgi:hypothetical protein
MDHRTMSRIMNRYTSTAALLSAALLASCSYEKNQIPDISAPLTSASALVRFFNFAVNAPQVNFYAGTQKVTAAIETSPGVESTSGVAYGSAGGGGFYSAIAPGAYTLTGNISATTDKDLAISSAPATLVAAKTYSFYMSGFYNTTTKKADGFVVLDDFDPTIDWTTAYVRFVNTISNSSPMILYAKDTTVTPNTEVALGAAIAYQGAGAFTKIPPGVYNLSTRLAGSSTNVIARSAVFFGPGKVYTISARGDITVTSTTATNRPILDNTANR